MKVRLKKALVLIWLFAAGHLKSQSDFTLRITDHHNKPLSYVVVNYKGVTRTSNDSGTCKLNEYTPGASLLIHKFGFYDTSIILARLPFHHEGIKISLALRFKADLLPEVSVSSSMIEEINPLRSDFVLGYELSGDYILQLLSEDNVLVIDLANKVRSRSKVIQRSQNIIKDPYGTIHLTTAKSTYRVHPYGPVLRVDTVPGDLAKLNWDLEYCDEALETTRFIRRYKDNNQTMAFFAMSSSEKNDVKLIKEITEENRKHAVAMFANETNSLNQYLASMGINKMTASNEEEMVLVNQAIKMHDMLEKYYTLPSYTFLKKINDHIYLFAHDIDSMFVYDRDLNLVNSKRINYHHLKIWGKELLVNEEKTKVYAKLIDHSKLMIAEIDLLTGTIKPPYLEIKSRFASKIRIRNDVAYYLAKQKDRTGYTMYSQRLH